MTPRALLIGFFSTVGDIDSLRIVQQWLQHAHLPSDVAPYSPVTRAAMPDTLNIRDVRPEIYTHLIIICGPCYPELFRRKTTFLERFAHCRKIGINLTMVRPLAAWNPFDDLLERDSDRTQRPDLTFLAPDDQAVPVAARCLIAKQRHYGTRQLHAQATAAINAALERNHLAPVDIDTRWADPVNLTGQRSSADIVSILRRTDLLLTTRLHGLVLGLRAGIPVIAIDPVRGGAKVSAQCQALHWPHVCRTENLTPQWMDQTIAWALSPDARPLVQATVHTARAHLASFESDFRAALDRPPPAAPGAKPGKPLFRWLPR
jgi:hypothetical protein